MRLALAAIVAALTSTLFTVVIAQNPPPIWAGVYTTAQAERGRAVVEAHCGECHQDDLSGGEGPALVGPTFMLKWEMNSVERLFHKIRDTMPEAGSSDVSDVEKLETVAYILQQNGFPAGATELTEASYARGPPHNPSRRAQPAALRRTRSGRGLSPRGEAQRLDAYGQQRSAGDDTRADDGRR